LAAQTAVFQSAAAGMPLPDVDALARNSIAAAGYGDYFGHGLGHGLGLEIHEAPFLSPRANIGAQLLPGMNVTIEPGIYIPGWGGVRIEDLALVTENGLEPLSRCPKTPLIPV
jgi:Xaa-Pro aminopeptidase